VNPGNQPTDSLSPEKMKLYERLLKQKGLKTLAEQTIPRRPGEGPCELSFAQQRLWFLDQFEPGGSAYNIPAALRLTGLLDVSVLEQCLQEIVNRHESLRTAFPIIDGQARQVVTPVLTADLSVLDLRKVSEIQREKDMIHIAAQEARGPFDLSKGPLWRVLALKIREDEHILLITMHHIISDGWSLGILARELIALYIPFLRGEKKQLPELPIQYGDYACWQHARIQGEFLKSELAYWKEQLRDASLILELPGDYPRPPVQSSQGALFKFELSNSLSQELQRFSREQETTLFMTLLAAFNVLLYRYTGQEDILVGSPIAGRDRPETEGLIGFFVNTLVLRTKLSARLSFPELLKQVREVMLDAYAHQNMPFEKLVEELNPERDVSRSPLFQVMFVLQNTPQPPVTLEGLTVTTVETESGTSQFDLSLSIREETDGLSGSIEYCTDLFAPETIHRFFSHFQVLLEAITAEPRQKLSELPLLTEAERHRILMEWNNTRADYPPKSIGELFEEQADRSPDEIAVISDSQTLTYRELNHSANRLARYLQKQGVTAEKPVGIYTECSLEMMIAVLGVLKAGGAYIPLDPAHPEERLSFIIKDARLTLILTQKRLERELPAEEATVICLDSDWEMIAGERDQNPECTCLPRNLACVIYTSGSTGEPKGVLLENQSLVNLISSFIRSYKVKAMDRVLPLTAIASASFAGEILPIICAGGALVLANKNEFLDYEKLVQLIRQFQVTIISTVPVVMARLNKEQDRLPELRLILSGGEALSLGDIDQLLTSTTVVNGYGLTETTICSTYYLLNATDIREGPLIPIGKPVMNHLVYVLDQNLNCLPPGCVGEIFIAGAGLARGYLNHPELTAAKFIPNPYVPGTRMFQTGDLAKWLPDGNLVYIGRKDHQVKIRGFRIETGEIEAVVSQHPGIRDVVVVAREDNPGEKRLVAYVTPVKEKLTNSELRQWLSEKIPHYMIPAVFEFLADLPLNANGKIDIKALPVPTGIQTQLEIAYQAPQTEAEQTISLIWQEFLHLDKVGIHDNFFDLGGHSLLIAQVHSKIRMAFTKDLSMVDMFKYPTISSLAKYLGQERNEGPTYQMVHDRVSQQKEALSKQKQIFEKRNKDGARNYG
jgi:amino acid adenylation domain-containing protein